MTTAKLTARQRRFIDEYLIDSNGTQAAIRAGFSKRTANKIAHQLLGKPHVAALIQARQAKLAAKFEITAERVISELAAVGFADIRDLYDESGKLRPISTLEQRVAASIAGIEVEEIVVGRGKKKTVAGAVLKVKRHDKVRALEALGRHFKLFTEKHEHSGPDGGPIPTRDMNNVERARRLAYILKKAAEEAAADESA